MKPDLMQTAFWLFVVLSLIGIGIAAAKVVRESYYRPEVTSDEVLAGIEEALAEGEISPEEYRKAKETLGFRSIVSLPKKEVVDDL